MGAGLAVAAIATGASIGYSEYKRHEAEEEAESEREKQRERQREATEQLYLENRAEMELYAQRKNINLLSDLITKDKQPKRQVFELPGKAETEAPLDRINRGIEALLN